MAQPKGYIMGKPKDDIKFETLHHWCIHSHTKTYLDKAVVPHEKAACPSSGLGPDKAVVKGPTTWALSAQTDPNSRFRQVEAQPGLLARPTPTKPGLASTENCFGNKRRTRCASQRTAGGHQEDKKGAQGSTRRGQQEDNTHTQGLRAWPLTVASVFKYDFSLQRLSARGPERARPGGTSSPRRDEIGALRAPGQPENGNH